MPDAGWVDSDIEICLKYLPYDTTEVKLKEYFASCGAITGEPSLMRNPQGGCKGMGWINFASPDGATKALKMNGCKFMGRNLQVTRGRTRAGAVKGTVQAAGTHSPALIEEVLARLVAPNPDGVYIDGTFGRGGHSRGILGRLSKNGQLHAFDMDDAAVEVGKTLEKEDARFHMHKGLFSTMFTTMKGLGLKVDGVLLDIGISSPQLDGDRGFRPEMEGPLDLRFDLNSGVPAYEYLQTVSAQELAEVLVRCGGEDAIAAQRIADMVVMQRQTGTLPKRTQPFAEFVRKAKGKEYQAMHPAKLTFQDFQRDEYVVGDAPGIWWMTFQALRIHLNKEFEQLQEGIRASLKTLKTGGKLGIITWKHSECALVVKEFHTREVCPSEYPLMEWFVKTQPKAAVDALPQTTAWFMEPVTRPSARELGENSRARSALLHVLTKKKGVKISDLEEVAYPLLGMETAKHTKGVKGKAAQSGDDERPKKKKAAAAAAEERPRKKKKGDRDG